MNRQNDLFRGVLAGVAWLAWVAAGYAFVADRGPIRDVVQALSREQPVYLYGWVMVSAILLFLAILLVLRGLSARRTT